jgi:hypothetical protein
MWVICVPCCNIDISLHSQCLYHVFVILCCSQHPSVLRAVCCTAALALSPLPFPCPQAVAQGRVWTGQRALQRKLVDVLGGLHEAVALVKQAAGIEQSEKVTLVEVTRGRTSPLALIGERGCGDGGVHQLDVCGMSLVSVVVCHRGCG